LLNENEKLNDNLLNEKDTYTDKVESLKDAVIEAKDGLNDEIKKVMSEYNKNTNKNFNSRVEITKKTANIAEILVVKCANAELVIDFTPDNYGYGDEINKKFVKDFLYDFKNDNGQKYIGDFINETFLKDDKSKQSLFATDVSRLNCTLKRLTDGGKILLNGQKIQGFSAGNEKAKGFSFYGFR
jgi:hypothetical protein